MKKKIWDGCPVRFAAGIFGDKWTLVIIRDLMFKGRHYFGEFLEAGEGISTNVLSDRLAKLEEHKIVSREQDTNNLAKYIYRLTDKGLDLVPTMLSIINWSEKYDRKTQVQKDYIIAYRTKRLKFENQIRKKASDN